MGHRYAAPRILQVLPVAAGVPGEHWHPGGKHLLQRNTLGLVSAEIDHRAHAAAKGVKLVLAVGAVAQILDNETATSQRVRLRSDRLSSGGSTLAQSTGPISPGGVATLKADVQYRYEFSRGQKQETPVLKVQWPMRKTPNGWVAKP